MEPIILRNGISLEEALKKISVYKAPTKFLQDKYPYYKYGEYEERIKDAFGVGGYEVLYHDFKCEALPCIEECVSQVICQCGCTISVFSKDGNVVYRASGIGTKELNRNTDKRQYQMINNMGLFVQQAALKSAAKSMNIFDCNRFEEDTTEPVTGQNTGNGNRKANDTGKQEIVVSFLKKKPLETVRTDAQTNLPVYRLIGHEIKGNGCREKESEIILYPNCYKKEAEKINALLLSQDPVRVTIRASCGKCSDEGRFENTYIFKGFGGNS